MNKWASMAGLILALAVAPAWAQTTKTTATVKPVPANGESRYVGYYYPKPTSTETYTSQLQTIQGAECHIACDLALNRPRNGIHIMHCARQRKRKAPSVYHFDCDWIANFQGG